MSPKDRHDANADDRARRDAADEGAASGNRRRLDQESVRDRRPTDPSSARRQADLGAAQNRRATPPDQEQTSGRRTEVADATSARRAAERPGAKRTLPGGPGGVTRRALIGGGLALGALGALRPAPALALGRDPIKVVAATDMIADLIRRIGGHRVEVTTLIGYGADLHGWRPTQGDLALIAATPLTVTHGLGVANVEMLESGPGAWRSAIALGDTLPPETLRRDADGRIDPHVWMDPRIWARMIEPVRSALSSLDPGGAGAYAGAANGARAEFARLATYADGVLATVPDPARLLITGHAAFGYFGAAFGFEVAGLRGIDGAAPAPATLASLAALAAERALPAVFADHGGRFANNDPDMDALVAACAARGGVAQIGGALLTDAIGAEGAYEGTYPGMIDHNVTIIARALGGTAPAQGMRGQLAVGL
ncbi:MAG: manganese/zinc/iron transport system substrate-binding protein [Paracoccaceae bacterium]|jgi:manganese/zinc/iron transport system substrate-binding protein